jgi:hypothetical protein
MVQFITNSGIVEKIVSIDYLKAIEFINKKESMIPGAEIILATLVTLNNASNEYRSSKEDKNKNQQFLTSVVNNIDHGKTIAALKPVVRLIPYGGVLLFVLEMIVKFKRKH